MMLVCSWSLTNSCHLGKNLKSPVLLQLRISLAHCACTHISYKNCVPVRTLKSVLTRASLKEKKFRSFLCKYMPLLGSFGCMGVNGFSYVPLVLLPLYPPISRFYPPPLKVSYDLLKIDFLKQYLNSHVPLY